MVCPTYLQISPRWHPFGAQGISGYNMCRNGEDPLGDPKNRQMPLFFEVVRFLKPRWVLMENVADMFKFTTGIYGRFSVSQLIEQGYQARVGFVVAGRYGVPQYRLRCFLWGAVTGEPLPGYPMPSHRVLKVQQVLPAELKTNEVVRTVRGYVGWMRWLANDAHAATHASLSRGVCAVAQRAPPGQLLRREVRVRHMLEDLPKVSHDEAAEVQPYATASSALNSEFAKYCRSAPPTGHGVKHEPKVVYNHTPQPLPPDDLFRCEHIPLKKGACWRDLGTLSKVSCALGLP
jgi:DNA (cytosine-5)-methyltransferase 1